MIGHRKLYTVGYISFLEEVSDSHCFHYMVTDQ